MSSNIFHSILCSLIGTIRALNLETTECCYCANSSGGLILILRVSTIGHNLKYQQEKLSGLLGNQFVDLNLDSTEEILRCNSDELKSKFFNEKTQMLKVPLKSSMFMRTIFHSMETVVRDSINVCCNRTQELNRSLWCQSL